MSNKDPKIYYAKIAIAGALLIFVGLLHVLFTINSVPFLGFIFCGVGGLLYGYSFTKMSKN